MKEYKPHTVICVTVLDHKFELSKYIFINTGFQEFESLQFKASV